MFDWQLWLSFLCCFVFGAISQYYATRAKGYRTVITALLFILLKLHKRGVYMSPFDITIINEAHRQVRGQWRTSGK